MQPTPWQDQMAKAIRSTEELSRYFDYEFEQTPFPILLPLKLAAKIKQLGITSALGKQFLPSKEETISDGHVDPIGDHEYSPINGLVHRYGNRALYFPTSACPVICRYCFRKNELVDNKELFQNQKEEIKNYLDQHQEINEIILSGGDPLSLSNKKLRQEITFIGEFPSVKFLRFHTRFPAIMPDRIDDSFLKVLSFAKEHFKVINFVVHLNHPDEIDETLLTKLKKIKSLGIEVLTQTVLLKGINDDSNVLESLFLELASNGIRPYYLHHPDQVKGGLHFGLSLERGREIYNSFRQNLPGWAIPEYVVDLPGGKGKVPVFNSEKIEYSGRLIDRFGQLQDYSSPKALVESHSSKL
ncbi:MAG: KamA family radical SAM protein [Bacteriovoracaceae bacterium]|nr:KamA family radical SAM protein [Bacteriovoracaceae bacterium]